MRQEIRERIEQIRQEAEGSSGDAKRQKKNVPSFTSAGPTRRQVLVSFRRGELPGDIPLQSITNVVNSALIGRGSQIRILATSYAYGGWALATDDVAREGDVDIIRGRPQLRATQALGGTPHVDVLSQGRRRSCLQRQ